MYGTLCLVWVMCNDDFGNLMSSSEVTKFSSLLHAEDRPAARCFFPVPAEKGEDWRGGRVRLLQDCRAVGRRRWRWVLHAYHWLIHFSWHPDVKIWIDQKTNPFAGNKKVKTISHPDEIVNLNGSQTRVTHFCASWRLLAPQYADWAKNCVDWVDMLMAQFTDVPVIFSKVNAACLT